ncbi:MAG: carboxy terminal-processing peptidase [Opitutales bacterium]
MLLPRLRPLLGLLVLVTVAAAAPDRNYSTTPLMSNETHTLVQMLEYYHYNKEAVNHTDYAQLVTEYMGDLDPQRLYFTAADETALRTLYGPRLNSDLAEFGNIDPAFSIFRLYEQRVQSRSKWIFDQLAHDIDFKAKDTYLPDRSKFPWPADLAAADEVWGHRLKYELLPLLLDGKPIAEAKSTVQKRHERILKNIADVDASEIQELFLTSLTKMYDPHSSYFSADTLEDFSIQMRLSLVGIGAVLGLDDDGYCVVHEVKPGTPADLSGQIKVNDKITTVRQDGGEPVDIVGMKLRRIVELIRGHKGTKVILTVQPHDAAATGAHSKDVTIVRDVIHLDEARASAAIYDVPAADGTTTPVGVITLNSFYGIADEDGDTAGTQSNASKDVAELLGKLKKADVKAVVIDLRRNGGGALSEAINLTGLFIGQGPVVQVKDFAGHIQVDSDNNNDLTYSGPLALLTSRFSASASEIFAGALQNYGRAIIVGDSTTHGKGTVQAVLEMKNYLRTASKVGAAKLTIQKYYLPNGSSTQNKGVIPDVTLPSIDDFLPGIGEASLPHALIWDEIRSAPFDGQPLAKAFVQPIAQASLERQQTLEEFSFLQQSVNRFKEQVERKTVSLNLEEREAQKKADTEFKKKMDTELARLAKTDFPKREVKLDAVLAAEKANPKPAAVAAPATPEEGDTDALDSDTAAKLDIHLRETLRVVIDAAKLAKDPQYWANGTAPLAPAGVTRG